LGGRDDDSTGTETTRNGISRRHIRKRLKEKEKIPGHVQWIKWMNSEWKNRK
jgi:aquaporin related protein